MSLHHMAESTQEQTAEMSETRRDIQNDKGKEFLRPVHRVASRRDATWMDASTVGALVFRSKHKENIRAPLSSSSPYPLVFEDEDEDVEQLSLHEPHCRLPEETFCHTCPLIETDAGMLAFLGSPDNLEVNELAVRISLMTIIDCRQNHHQTADLKSVHGPFPSNVKRLSLLKDLGQLKVLRVQIFGASRDKKFVKNEDIQLGMKWLVEKLIRYQPMLQHLVVQYRLRHYRYIKPGNRRNPRPIPFACWDEVHMEFKRVVDPGTKDLKGIQWNATNFSILPNNIDEHENPKYKPWHTLMASVEYSTGGNHTHFDGALGGLFLLDKSLLTLDAATGRLALW